MDVRDGKAGDGMMYDGRFYQFKCKGCGLNFTSVEDVDVCTWCLMKNDKEKQDVSSDRYACAGCEKYFHELDLSKDKDGNLLCAPCSHAYDAGRVPRKEVATNFFCSQCKYESSWPFSVCGKCGAYGYCLDKRLPRDGESTLSVSLPEADHRIPIPPVKPCPEPDSSHYKHTSIDPLQYVEAMGDAEYRGACILNIVKYITRYPHKGTPMEDLLKAQDYVGRLIEHQKKKEHQP